MKNLGYYNGKFGEIEEMTVPMKDRACYFGDGVYEATMSRNYNIFLIDEHLDRLYNSAGLLKIKIVQTKEEMKAILMEMVSKMDSGDNFIYWQVSRGTAARNHIFPEGVSSNLYITISSQQIPDIYKKIKLITEEDTRFLHCNIKTINLIPSVMASQKAKEAGCTEAVLHRGDRVTECAHSNIHIIQDGILKTAPTDHLILPGITRAHIITACKKLGIPVDETPFTLDELMNADEIIVSSSSTLCRGAEEIDGKKVGGNAPGILKAIQDEVLREYMAETEN